MLRLLQQQNHIDNQNHRWLFDRLKSITTTQQLIGLTLCLHPYPLLRVARQGSPRTSKPHQKCHRRSIEVRSDSHPLQRWPGTLRSAGECHATVTSRQSRGEGISIQDRAQTSRVPLRCYPKQHAIQVHIRLSVRIAANTIMISIDS
jgi:hypothetical protein